MPTTQVPYRHLGHKDKKSQPWRILAGLHSSWHMAGWVKTWGPLQNAELQVEGVHGDSWVSLLRSLGWGVASVHILTPEPGGPGLCELKSPVGRSCLMGHVSGGWCFWIAKREKIWVWHLGFQQDITTNQCLPFLRKLAFLGIIGFC